MSTNYLHERKDFSDLLRLLEQETGILAYLIEKDYWIMHVLYGLKKMGLESIFYKAKRKISAALYSD